MLQVYVLQLRVYNSLGINEFMEVFLSTSQKALTLSHQLRYEGEAGKHASTVQALLRMAAATMDKLGAGGATRGFDLRCLLWLHASTLPGFSIPLFCSEVARALGSLSSVISDKTVLDQLWERLELLEIALEEQGDHEVMLLIAVSQCAAFLRLGQPSQAHALLYTLEQHIKCDQHSLVKVCLRCAEIAIGLLEAGGMETKAEQSLATVVTALSKHCGGFALKRVSMIQTDRTLKKRD